MSTLSDIFAMIAVALGVYLVVFLASWGVLGWLHLLAFVLGAVLGAWGLAVWLLKGG